MYEGIVGTNAVGKLDNIAEIDVLSKLDISELQRDLVPLISIIKNEDPSSSEKILFLSPQYPAVSSATKGIQVGTSTDDMMAQLRLNVEKLKDLSPLNST